MTNPVFLLIIIEPNKSGTGILFEMHCIMHYDLIIPVSVVPDSKQSFAQYIFGI